MPNIGPMELVLVLVVALLFLGPKRLPAAARSLGEGIRGFKETLTTATPPADEQIPPSNETSG
jgi:sec-independent protein translocase protein TatA